MGVRSTKRWGGKFGGFAEAGAATTHIEHFLNLLSEDPFAELTFPPTRIVELFSAPSRAKSPQHFRFPLREMFIEPVLEPSRDRPRQPQQNIAGELRAGFGAPRDTRPTVV